MGINFQKFGHNLLSPRFSRYRQIQNDSGGRISLLDGPSDFFIKRCIQYKRKGPEKDWDGVFNLTTK